jgi:hypothetical protein
MRGGNTSSKIKPSEATTCSVSVGGGSLKEKALSLRANDGKGRKSKKVKGDLICCPYDSPYEGGGNKSKRRATEGPGAPGA